MSLNKIIFILLICFTIQGCTEAYPLMTNTYEEAIVIEATVTNELKNQEIKLTKTSKFEDKNVQAEKGANVLIKDDQNNEYQFEEKDGLYKSVVAFQIMPDREYTLEIKTTDGKVYKSTTEKLTTVSSIESITPSVTTNKDNVTGVEINLKSNDPTGTSRYYRYEYEETYKIIAPRWSPYRVIPTGPESVAVVQNVPNTRICYSTKNSTDIILINTNDKSEDRVDFPIRFIEENNYIIGHRYSILVKQYTENLEAYTFHRTMRDMSGSASILSPKQPGIINGNIRCTTDSKTKVIGYFDVASVSEKRIFFNYNDMFPGKPAPYFNTCDDIPFNFCFRGLNCDGESMMYNVENELMSYILDRNLLFFILTPVECGDCTSFSSNVVPPFWIE